MMDFATAFNVPVLIELDGKEFPLKRLSIYDYREWLGEIQKEFLERNLALIPATASENEKAAMKSRLMARKFSPDDLRDQVFNIDGMDRVYKLSFVKSMTSKRLSAANKDEADVVAAIKKAEEYIEANPSKQIEMQAVKLSGLFTEAQYNRTYELAEEPKLPNASAAPLSAANQSTGL